MFLSVQYYFAGLVIRMYFLNHFDNFAGAGSTALHYAACGGNAECCQVCTLFYTGLDVNLVTSHTDIYVFLLLILCVAVQILISRGSSLSAENANGYVSDSNHFLFVSNFGIFIYFDLCFVDANVSVRFELCVHVPNSQTH